MFFGKYLIDNKRVDPNKIVEGTIAQVESTPSLLRILYESQKVDSTTLVSLLDQSMRESRPIEVLIVEKNILTELELEEVLSMQSQGATGLAQWLLSENILDTENLKQSIESFNLNKTEEPVKLSSVEELVSDPKESDKPAPKLSAAAIESMKELGIYVEEEFETEDASLSFNGIEEDNDSEVVEDGFVSSILTENVKDELIAIVKVLVSGLDKDHFTTIHTIFYKILGVCKINDSTIFSKLLDIWIKVIDSILLDKIDYTEKNYSLILKNIKEVIVLSWDIREAMNGDGELSLLKDSEWKARYLKSIESGIRIYK